ncbi:MAG: hypothetical protein ACOYK6_07015 [Chthoniobacterales bacterium]
MTKKPLSQKIAAATSKLSKAVSTSVKKPKSVSPKKEKKQECPINLAQEHISLRAYFISERRRELGWEGDEQEDWFEAEKQLLAELAAQRNGHC